MDVDDVMIVTIAACHVSVKLGVFSSCLVVVRSLIRVPANSAFPCLGLPMILEHYNITPMEHAANFNGSKNGNIFPSKH